MKKWSVLACVISVLMLLGPAFSEIPGQDYQVVSGEEITEITGKMESLETQLQKLLSNQEKILTSLNQILQELGQIRVMIRRT